MLNRILQERCSAGGSRTAVVFGTEHYSYAQLEERVARCAAGLRRLDAAPENGVALVMGNCPEFIFTSLAASSLGIPIFMVDPASKSTERQRVFTGDRIALAVCDPEQISSLEQIREQIGQDFLICSVGRDFEGLMGRATEPLPSQIYDAETATVQYTSGTTGVSKCIARSHRNYFCEAENFNQTVGVCADDRILCTIPIFHSYGFGSAFLAALYAGATLVLMDGFNRAAVAEVLERERITIFPAVPLMIDLLSQRGIGPSRRGNSLRLVISGAAPLSSAVAREMREAFGTDVRQQYGSTETGPAAINLDVNPSSTLDSVGLPVKNVRIEILREDGTPVPSGEVGEVAIQSPAMASGYLRQPELTQQKFRNGYFWPGEFGRKDERGYLYIERRVDWLVLSSGRKVDPHEVEAVIATFPKVREVAVVGIKGQIGEPMIKAVVVSREACQKQEIVDFCRERLADFKIPRVVEFVQEIPHSSTGKILRKDLIF